MIRRTVAAFACVVLCAGTAAAQTVFLVRHAERADAGMPAVSGADPNLSEVGRQRAAALAAALKDAQIRAIFVTEYKRTQETAVPLAQAIGVKPTVVTAKDVAGLVAKLKEANGNTLVVGHSNSVPEIIKALGVTTPVTIADAEFDHLFLVTVATARMIQLHYR